VLHCLRQAHVTYGYGGSEQHGVTFRFFIIIGKKKMKDARFLYFLNDMLYLYSTILTNFADEFTTLYIETFPSERHNTVEQNKNLNPIYL